MKLHLANLTISNFRGISGSHTIKLNSSVVFLTGPNGYGKTTIYDAIELCLTGKILRIEKTVGHENANKRHYGSVLHNDPNRDIVIQLEVTKDGEKRSIQVFCPKGESKQQFIDWGKFRSSFLDSDGKPSGSRSDVDRWLNFDQDNYRLFTYLQQSDSTFFLKLAQKERHMMLNPLLDTTGKYNDELQSIESFRSRLTGYNSHLTSKLKSFDDNSKADSVNIKATYARLFTSGNPQEVDEKEPFKGLEIEAVKAKHRKIQSDIEELGQFFQQFVPDEYINSEKQRFLDRFSRDKNFIRRLALRDVLSDGEMLQLSTERLNLRDAIEDSDTIKKYLLRDYLDEKSFEKFRLQAEKYQEEHVALYKDENLLPIPDILKNITSSHVGFSHDDKSRAKSYLEEHIPVARSTSEYSKLLGEYQTTRAKLAGGHSELLKHDGTKNTDHHCPLCGHDWLTARHFRDAVDRETKLLETLLSKDYSRLQKLESRITVDFLKPVIQRCNDKLPDSLRYRMIKDLGVLDDNDVALNESLSRIFPNIKDILRDDSLQSNSEVESATNRILNYVKKEISDDEVEVTRLTKNLQSEDYSNYFAVLEKLNVSIPDNMVLRPGKLPAPQELRRSVRNIGDMFLQLADKIIVKPDNTLPEHVRLYKDLLGARKDNFDRAKSRFNSKKLYVDQQYRTIYFNTKRLIEVKQEKIQILLSKVGTLKSAYSEALRVYQNEIMRALQLPFYIYSAKILQNSPQCLGIFMFAQQDSGTIVFTTQRGATHDIYPQLSSGQLVVVSMAFYLAINSTFPHQSSSLMAIDDPIQDLDSLNVQSLTELLRREFVGNYQLLMSTHDELDVNYMKYKFERTIGRQAVIDIDVQQTFFGLGAKEK